MTYRKLLKALQELPSETLDGYNVTIRQDDEFYPVAYLEIADNDNDVVDEGTPVIVIL